MRELHASVMDGWLEPPHGRLPGVVNWMVDIDYLSDAGSFESAAATLVAGWQKQTNDGLIKPILYLCRHAAELHLKAAIKLANECVNEPYQDVEEWFRRQARHSLLRLRNRLLELLSRPELGPVNLPLGEDTPEGKLLVELHELDPAGDELRYPTRWDQVAGALIRTRMPGGADTFGRSVLIDVERMGADLARLNTLLGGVHDWLYEARYQPQTEQQW